MAELREVILSSQFGSPRTFWIGLGLLLLLVFVPVPRRRRVGLALDLTYWKSRVEFGSKRKPVYAALAGIICVLIASLLADPSARSAQITRVYGRPVMVVVDVSGSMEYVDRRRSRGVTEPQEAMSNYEKAQHVVNHLVSQGLQVDFGLLLYSTENYVARYFTPKVELLRDALENEEEVSFIATGTRTSEALAKAHKFLSDNVQAPEKAIVLISDLQADDGETAATADAIERARWAGIKVYVILIERRSAFEKPPALGMKAVSVVDMDDMAGVNEVYDQISTVQSSLIREEESRLRRSLIPFLVPPTLGLVMVCLVLSETYFRKVP